MVLKIRSLWYRLRGSSLFRDSFWALFGNAAGKGLALIAGIAIARFLGSEEYGEYGLIKGTLLSIAIFSSFGLGYTATKFIAESRLSDMDRVRNIHRVNLVITILSSALIAIVVSLFAQPIAVWLKDSNLSGTLRWSAIAIVFNAIITTQTGELSGFRAYKIIARNNIISGLITFLFIAPAAYFGGLRWAIIALVISLLSNCIINTHSIRQILKREERTLSKKFPKKLAREILTFSFPIALQESTYSIASWIGMAMMIRLASYSTLGVYSASSQWMAVMLFIPGALRNVALSHLSENASNTSASKSIGNRLLLVNFIFTFIPFVIIAILSKWIATLYGPSFDKMPLVLNVCIFTAVISSMTNVLTQDMIAHGKNWYLFWTRLIRDSLSLIISYTAVTNLNYYPATLFAVSHLAMQFLYFIMLLVKRKKLYSANAKIYSKKTIGFAESLETESSENKEFEI